ncbi:conserved hypothetical protein [Vibrio aestuarianus]|uniref:Uncharacterized protein n=2 Tax=Vibrio aestuarianus TaxID=28171 RepID=A0ABN8TQ05_9VIBR|nr:hypothetical protein [Vibrio aestuarianus]MDE1259058.1 hypothetical protein [Vibrio aestuarianus]NLS60401.1 hypothetical protein [Vibrio aestuarianus subsp. francensis]CAH8203485.1 conserved hypothetical protein [Vibrio aestuarianus]CAH8230060.1 conserved hypothetical protein [Vibrio aestuarianus]
MFNHVKMNKIGADVAISEIPKIVVEIPSTTDWFSIGSIALTALIVVGTTIMTIRNLTKTIKLQEELADKNSNTELEKSRREQLASNRQVWINNLRDYVSDFIAAVCRVDDFTKTSDTKLKIFQKQSSDIQIQSMMSMYESTDHWLAQALSLKAKINLHLNPLEQESKELLELLNSAYQLAESSELENEHGRVLGTLIGNIESKTQTILKTEWERVKRME